MMAVVIELMHKQRSSAGERRGDAYCGDAYTGCQLICRRENIGRTCIYSQFWRMRIVFGWAAFFKGS